MASYRQKLEWWTGRRCSGPLASLELLGRYPVRVQPELVDAVAAMHRELVAAGYRNPTGPTGSYSCRKIGGSRLWSLHAYGIAIDLDYAMNPHLRQSIRRGFDTDPRFLITEAQVAAVESIVNSHGERLWRWLGWTIGDTMHFEIDVPPDRCDVEREDEMRVDTPTWASAIRDADIDQMVTLGVLTTNEAGYWKNKNAARNWSDPEWQDLRNAYDVRLPLYG